VFSAGGWLAGWLTAWLVTSEKEGFKKNARQE
jgi:hypothetical protein